MKQRFENKRCNTYIHIRQVEDKTSIRHQNGSKHADIVHTYIGAHDRCFK